MLEQHTVAVLTFKRETFAVQTLHKSGKVHENSMLLTAHSFNGPLPG